MIRKFIVIAIMMATSFPFSANADPCAEVRPFRAIENEFEMAGEAGVETNLFLRALGVSGGLGGKTTVREAFPAIEGASSLSEKQYLHYIACQVILNSIELSPIERMALLNDWRSQSTSDIRDKFRQDLNSDDILTQIETIDWAMTSNNAAYHALAIEKALSSDSAAIRGRLLELFLNGIKTVSGVVTTKSQSREENHSFSVIFDEWSKQSGSLNFSGRFAGGVFRVQSLGAFARPEDRERNELADVVGSVRGNSFHASNDFCTASGDLKESEIVGILSCMGPVRLELTGNVPAGGSFKIPIFERHQ